MGQDTTTALLIISVLGTTRVYVVLLAGFLASKWPRREPLLNKEACRCISRICAQLFLPALVISTTGGTLNPAALLDSWQLVVAGGFTIALSVFLSGLLGRLLLQPEDRRAFRPVQLAAAFSNCLGFPLLLMESLCEQDDINRDFGGDAVECFTQATGMLFTYFVVWQVCFYGWGFYAIGDGDTLELKLTGQPVSLPSTIEDADTPTSEPSEGMAHVEGTPSMGTRNSAVCASVAAVDHRVESATSTALSAPASHHAENRAATALGGGDDEHGTELQHMEVGDVGKPSDPREGTGVLPLAVEAGQRGILHALKWFLSGNWRSEEGRTSTAAAIAGALETIPCHSGWPRLKHRISVVLTSPNIISVMVGVVIAMIFELQQQLFHNPQAVLRPLGAAIETLGTPTVAVSTLVMAGSLVQTSTVEAGVKVKGGAGGAQWNVRRFRYIAGALHILCRLILVPAVGFAVFWATTAYSTVLGENRLMHLIMLIELGMPSAALVIVSLNQLEMPATAGFMARLYLSQYGASMFTITMWTALAVHMV